MASAFLHRVLPAPCTAGCPGRVRAGLAATALTATALTSAWLLGFATPVLAQDSAIAKDAAKDTPPPSASFPLSGTVEVGSSLGAGTFVPGEGQRTSLDLSLNVVANYRVSPALKLAASVLVGKNVLTNVDSGAVRPGDTTLADLDLSAGYTLQELGADGVSKPADIVGGTNVSFGLGLTLPTSRRSQFQTKLFSAGPSVTLSRPGLFGGMLTLSGTVAFIKDFHQYTTSVYDDPEAAPLLGRPGGAEMIGDGLVASGTYNRSFYVRSRLGAALQFTEKLSAAVSLLVYNNFTYDAGDTDEFSSPYAKGGRGRSDTQRGIIQVGYQLTEKTGIELSSDTWSPPFSNDNQVYRFPFFDFRSTADNYTSVGLSVSHAF